MVERRALWCTPVLALALMAVADPLLSEASAQDRGRVTPAGALADDQRLPSGFTPAPDKEVVTPRDLAPLMDKLRPLHAPVPAPRPGEWLAEYPERGQTFEEYLRFDPVTPCGARSTIYVQPLGAFSPTQRRIVDLSAEFLGIYLGCQVRVLEDLPLSVVPDRARRRRGEGAAEQLLTTFILDELLKPKLPADAAALIAFTAADLYPEPSWNFVFGQASLRDRVGVWSMHRFGDPDAGEGPFRRCLVRTLATATHETGHMFSVQHCTSYACNMCGSNSLVEGDRWPLHLCPECLAKVCWASQSPPRARFQRLIAFCERAGLAAQAAAYRTFLEALGS